MPPEDTRKGPQPFNLQPQQQQQPSVVPPLQVQPKSGTTITETPANPVLPRRGVELPVDPAPVYEYKFMDERGKEYWAEKKKSENDIEFPAIQPRLKRTEEEIRKDKEAADKEARK